MRLTAAALLLAACGVTLSGCGRSSSPKAKLPPALSAALQGGALNASGEGPMWALQIRPKALTFSSEQVASIDLPNAGPASAPGGGLWSGVAGGRPFQARITASACRDAATGLSYPLDADVTALGVTYHGCAARAGEGLGPPPQAQ